MQRTQLPRSLRRALYASVVAASIARSASAQCNTWEPGFGARGASAPVFAITSYDDRLGPQPSLYASGRFRFVDGVPVSNFARWNGSAWSAVPTAGLAAGSHARAFVVFADGLGPQPALYAGGSFGGTFSVARYDGTSWSFPLPPMSNAVIHAMAIFDDGSGGGPELYVAGQIGIVGGTPMNNIARWDGTALHPLGSGLTGTSGPQALAVYDDGSGPALYAGGYFTTAGGSPAARVARWDGVSWSALGAGVDATVWTMTVHDDGSGAALYVGGEFQSAGGSTIRGIARWDGSSWSPVGGTFGTTYVFALAEYDDGSGTKLYANGGFSPSFPGIEGTATKVWDGASWSDAVACASDDYAHSMAVYDDGTGPVLVTAGDFTSMDCLHADRIASFDGSTWSALGDEDGLAGVNDSGGVYALALHRGPGDAEPALYAGGSLRAAGDGAGHGVARWDGADWQTLDDAFTRFDTVRALVSHDDGTGPGPQLYAGGTFGLVNGVDCHNIARWDGTSWSALGGVGFTDDVNALAVFDDGLPGGPKLYAGGRFTTFWPNTSNQAHHLATWNGASWQPLFLDGEVCALFVHDDGLGFGERLFIGGRFNLVSGVPMHGITVYRSAGFNQLGSGTNGDVLALAEFDDGTGPKLFVGGTFTTAGGVPVNNIARWDGSSWADVGGGVTFSPAPTRVTALAVFDDGSGNGPALYAGGNFTSAGGNPATGIAKWNGAVWQAVDQGTFAEPGSTNLVRALLPAPAGPIGAPALFAGGRFDAAGSRAAFNVAAIASCENEPGFAFCFGDGSLATPCPCAPPNTVPNPSGASDAGCANSFHLTGGKLEAHGLTSPDSVVLRASDLSPFGFTQFFVGDAVVAGGFAVGDGVRCAGGALIRFGGQNADVGTARYPKPSVGWTLPLSTFGVPPSGGPHVRTYQALYRNPAANFCGPGTINITNAYGITWN